MIILTNQGEKRAAERGIMRAWIEETIASPDWTAPDPLPGVTRSYRAIVEFGGRVLRVVHRSAEQDIVVMTAFFDRNVTR